VARLWVGLQELHSWQEQGIVYHCIQTGSGADQVPYPLGAEGKVAGSCNWPLPVLRWRMCGGVPTLPTRLHGVVLSYE